MTNQIEPITIECPECEEGQIYIDTSSSCGVYPYGECCGGCGHNEECEECEGTGEIEVPEGYTKEEYLEHINK